MRDLQFDGYWEGEAVYSCDECGNEERFRFDSNNINSNVHRAILRTRKGWITTKVNDDWKDFCCEKCRNDYIRKHTL